MTKSIQDLLVVMVLLNLFLAIVYFSPILAFEFGIETAAERIAKRAKAKIKVEKVCAVDSQDMTDSEREIILSKILQNENTNFVVTHGTDTLIETALFLKKHVPFGTVVLIGAKLPEVFKVWPVFSHY